MDWLGFNFKCVSHHGWENFSDLMFRLLENALVKLFLPLAWSGYESPGKTTPRKLAQKSLFSHAKLF